jgi:HD-GYP domain-containing protein (c-di-GMP phosphodiesterase class II)
MSLVQRFRSSISYPIIATLVLLTVVPVSLVGYALARLNRNHLETLEKQFLTRQASSLSSELKMIFSTNRAQLESTARALVGAENEPVESHTDLLESIMQRAPNLLQVQLLDRSGDGRFVRRHTLTEAEDHDLTAELVELHGQAMEQEQVAPSAGVVHEVPEHGLLLLSFPLSTRSGDPWGVLQGVVDFGDLDRQLTSDDAFRRLIVSVVNRTGQVVLSSRQSLVGTDLSDAPTVGRLVRVQQRLTTQYPHPALPEAGDVLGSVCPIESLRWSVLVERPTAEAFGLVRSVQRNTAYLSAAAAIAALLIGVLISRRLIGPIQSLAEASSEIAEGNLQVRTQNVGPDEIGRLAENFNHMASSVEDLVRKLRQALRQNQELFLDTIRTLAAAIDAKDPYTRGHSERVSAYALAIGRHLGLSQEAIFRLRISAILHDVGKLGIKDGILNKPGGLDDDEFAVMKRHPEIGAQIMAPIRMLKDIIPGIRNHHEVWQGGGYPDGLMGEQIPMVARIIAVADTFDAMTTNRPYQEAMSLDYVVSKIHNMAGNRFDPNVVDAFLKAVRAGDITPPAQQRTKEAS